MNQGELAPSIMSNLAEKNYREKTPTHREKKSLQDIMKEHTKKNKQREREQERTNKDK
jgi:hypothetical protein